MPYIGVSPQFGVRRKHTYTATAGQTSFSGAGSEGATLSYTDSNFVDVYQNGVKLGDADYTSTSGTAIVLAQGASVDDIVEIIVFDAFSAADTVSKADGGTFDGAVTFAGGVSGGVVFNDDSASVDFRIESNDDANMFFLDGSANAIGIRTSTDHGGQLNVETTGQAYNVVLACTDDDANHGPLLDFKRISSSPADNDLLGEISFRGRNDNTEDITYATITSKIKDASDGTEDGNLHFNLMIAGTSREVFTITRDSVVVNQEGIDLDFRVESDSGNTNSTDALKVVASNGQIFSTAVYNWTTSSAANVVVTSSAGHLARSTSALKYKKDVRDLEDIDIDKFRPIRYKSKSDIDDQTKDNFGFIADEVHDAGITELVTYDGDVVEGFQYERLTAVLVKTLQEQKKIIKQLEARITALESK